MKAGAAAIRQELLAMQDLPYREFHARLIPTVEKDRIIGIRTPKLRAYAKQLRGTPAAEAFLSDLPHHYYEENNLHAFLLEQERELDRLIAALDAFLPHVDNWATCDSLSPRILAVHRAELLPHLERWMASEDTYCVRFGIEMLMKHYLTDAFSPEYPARVASLCCEEYYINMMVAWYFATALALRFEEIRPYLAEHRLSPWVHDKTIQKGVESYRLSPRQKQELRALRTRKEK